jgi:hypothetical protein
VTDSSPPNHAETPVATGSFNAPMHPAVYVVSTGIMLPMESVVPALLQIAQGRVVGGFVKGSLGVWDASFFPTLSVFIRQMRNVKLLVQLVFVLRREGVRGNLILVRGPAAILQIRSRAKGIHGQDEYTYRVVLDRGRVYMYGLDPSSVEVEKCGPKPFHEERVTTCPGLSLISSLHLFHFAY